MILNNNKHDIQQKKDEINKNIMRLKTIMRLKNIMIKKKKKKHEIKKS